MMQKGKLSDNKTCSQHERTLSKTNYCSYYNSIKKPDAQKEEIDNNSEQKWPKCQNTN